VSERSLQRSGWIWTLTTIGHTVPFVAVAGLLLVLNPITAPVALVMIAHAWVIPELYAARGSNVLRDRVAGRAGRAAAESTALGLLGDLVGHDARRLLAQTGLVLERGELGTWLIGQAGAVLVRPGGGRVNCYCVKATDPELPTADRTAHLLLALRTDETGFATVANLAFSGARWRLRRRLPKQTRQALDEAVALARR
jgi:hypothetical protein